MKIITASIYTTTRGAMPRLAEKRFKGTMAEVVDRLREYDQQLPIIAARGMITTNAFDGTTEPTFSPDRQVGIVVDSVIRCAEPVAEVPQLDRKYSDLHLEVGA